MDESAVRGMAVTPFFRWGTGHSGEPRCPPLRGAQGSQILVTNRVHGALEHRVEGTSLGTMDFKGLSPPVPVFEIADLR